jgi:hypothetical protein
MLQATVGFNTIRTAAHVTTVQVTAGWPPFYQGVVIGMFAGVLVSFSGEVAKYIKGQRASASAPHSNLDKKVEPASSLKS